MATSFFTGCSNQPLSKAEQQKIVSDCISDSDAQRYGWVMREQIDASAAWMQDPNANSERWQNARLLWDKVNKEIESSVSSCVSEKNDTMNCIPERDGKPVMCGIKGEEDIGLIEELGKK